MNHDQNKGTKSLKSACRRFYESDYKRIPSICTVVLTNKEMEKLIHLLKTFVFPYRLKLANQNVNYTFCV